MVLLLKGSGDVDVEDVLFWLVRCRYWNIFQYDYGGGGLVWDCAKGGGVRLGTILGVSKGVRC